MPDLSKRPPAEQARHDSLIDTTSVLFLAIIAIIVALVIGFEIVVGIMWLYVLYPYQTLIALPFIALVALLPLYIREGKKNKDINRCP